MSEDRKFRLVQFPCDLFARQDYLLLSKRHPLHLDWLMRCVVLAREALQGGRIEAGGHPLDAEALAILFRADDLQPWLTDCLKYGALTQDADQCYTIPNWSHWYRDKDQIVEERREASGHAPAVVAFLREWVNLDLGPAKAKELVDIARAVGIRAVSDAPDEHKASVSLGKILTALAGKQIEGMVVSHKRDRTGVHVFRVYCDQSYSQNGLPEPPSQDPPARPSMQGVQGVNAGGAGGAGGSAGDAGGLNLQPSTYNLQPTTFNLQPTTNNQQPSTYNQHDQGEEELIKEVNKSNFSPWFQNASPASHLLTEQEQIDELIAIGDKLADIDEPINSLTRYTIADIVRQGFGQALHKAWQASYGKFVRDYANHTHKYASYQESWLELAQELIDNYKADVARKSLA